MTRRYDISGSRDPHGPNHSNEQSGPKELAKPMSHGPVTKGGGNKIEEEKRDPEDGGGSNNQKGHKDALRDDDLKQLDLDRVLPPDSQQSEDLPLKGKSTALHLEPEEHSCTTDDAQSMGSETLVDTSSSWNASFLPSVLAPAKGFVAKSSRIPTAMDPPREKAASGNGQDTGKSSNVHGKRKASDVGDIQGCSSSAKPKLSVQSSVLDDDNRKFACHFFKKDSVAYASCCNIKNRHIKDVTAHLRKVHMLDCPGCTGRFESTELQAAHFSDSSCLEAIGSTTVKELKVPRTHNEGPIKRWYFIWRKLFPNLEPPQCPFWQPNEPSASQLYNYMMENLLNGTDPEENVEPIVQRVRTLWADFLNSYAESSSRQLATPETSSGSTFGGSSATNASPASHRASMDRTLAMLAPSPQGPEREPSHVQATPSSLGVGPVSSTHGRQMVETQPDDATLFSESSELQEGSRSSHAATSPGPHPEATPEEQQPYDMRSPTSTLEAGPGTNNHTATDDVRPTQLMITPEGGPELEGLLSEHVDSDQVNFGNFDFELCITPEFNADFDDNFDFMTQCTYNAGHFEDLEDDPGVGN
ncbi:hypothetical protein PG995_009874 [Apiospora arundinis]